MTYFSSRSSTALAISAIQDNTGLNFSTPSILIPLVYQYERVSARLCQFPALYNISARPIAIATLRQNNNIIMQCLLFHIINRRHALAFCTRLLGRHQMPLHAAASTYKAHL